MKQFLSLAALLFGISLGAQDWGGRYVLTETVDGNSPENTVELILIPMGKDQASFMLQVPGNPDLRFDTDGQGIPVEEGILLYNYPAEEFEYSILVELKPDLDPEQYPAAVRVKEIYQEAPDGDIPLGGIYVRSDFVLIDKNGYLYELDDKAGCMLRRGGNYGDKVVLPKQVRDFDGNWVRVNGIAADAFTECPPVGEVVLNNESQWVEPGAYWITGIPYDWDKLNLPHFAYPSRQFDLFVTPLSPDDKIGKQPDHNWIIFKQNANLAFPSADTRKNKDAKCGRDDLDFDNIQGLYYKALEPKRKQFRGYGSFEVEVLVADSEFAAFHRWPSFSRWKFPEPELNTTGDIELQVSRMFGRDVARSRKIGWLREGAGELDIVEFVHSGGEAMVAFVWHEDYRIVAVGTLSTEVEEGQEDSVWAVDDEGFYGIPNLISIAIAPDGAVTLFLAKDSPESITCFILHQVGQQFQYIDADQWYRFVG